MLDMKRFICGPLDNNVVVIIDRESSDCAIVDPGMDIAKVEEHIDEHSLNVKLILCTHGHFDHIYTLAVVKSKYDAPVAYHSGDQMMIDKLVETSTSWGMPGASPAPPADIELTHGMELELGSHKIKVLHTPGHSPGQVAFVFNGNAIVGDTLFHRSIGRWDLPGGDFTQLEQSILTQLYTLPEETVVWPGHGPKTTVDEEKRLNPMVGDGARFKPKL